ncbi:MAG: hypothetical protein KKD73_07795 [Proteobacteria bacterium]|nr:hypothetical protein [Pseudomonadota bacterium]
MKILLAVTTLTLLVCSEAQCYLLDYAPFANADAYQACSMSSPLFKEIKSSGSIKWQREYLVENGAETTEIQVFAHTDKGIFASIATQDKPNSTTKPFHIGVLPFAFEKVLAIDLNQDHKKDFVFISWTGGVGIAGSTSYVTFALSSEQGYQALQTTTFAPKESDFIEINGECKFMHTSLIYGEEGQDGKAHNYWVYNLFGFESQSMTPQNNVDARFPKWIMYSSKPNHTATRQLTTAQKQRLWQQEEELFVIPGYYTDIAD